MRNIFFPHYLSGEPTLFISHTEHSGLRYQNITKTKRKVPSCFSRMPQNKEINTNNKIQSKKPQNYAQHVIRYNSASYRLMFKNQTPSTYKIPNKKTHFTP